MKTMTESGVYVLNSKHLIDLQDGNVCSHPDDTIVESFADMKAALKKYPKLKQDEQL